jgi:hypothetical protein
MNLSSLASSALATTRSTFKGLAEAAVATGDDAAPVAAATVKPEVKTAEKAEAVETSAARPKGVRRGTVLDAYA